MSKINFFRNSTGNGCIMQTSSLSCPHFPCLELFLNSWVWSDVQWKMCSKASHSRIIQFWSYFLRPTRWENCRPSRKVIDWCFTMFLCSVCRLAYGSGDISCTTTHNIIIRMYTYVFILMAANFSKTFLSCWIPCPCSLTCIRHRAEKKARHIYWIESTSDSRIFVSSFLHWLHSTTP